jgi:thiol-disulfide isomerase/thioredoxin
MSRLLYSMTVALGLLANAAAASGWPAYSSERFEEAQAAGETIIVDVAADWCPTCRAQAPILDELAAEDALEGVIFLRVDFDTEKAFLNAHRIPRQSTIVVFKGVSEVDRSIAETDRERLRSFVFDAVAQ